MKKITFVVPCYNSADYMGRCVDSLLKAGNDTEIIIVNDGSSDDTGKIADKYMLEYPEIIRVIHKENGGHGSGVNAGLAQAKGLYFKVVDSDDWLEEEALKELMEKIASFNKDDRVDLIICNYVYNHLHENKTKSMDFTKALPEKGVFTWNDIKRFKVSEYLVMHAMIFKTEVLRESKVKLPEHTFYVDNLFTNWPLNYVNTIIYMNIDLYHYYLGREDQSVNSEVMMRRIDQQIKVTKLVLEKSDIYKAKEKSKKLADYLLRNVSIMLCISDVHLLMIDDDASWDKRKELWNFIKNYDKKIYYKLRFTHLAGLTYLPGKVLAKVTMYGYRKAKDIYEFS